jgi:hypothetical protein
MSDYHETIENNPVLKRMYQLASLRFGSDRVVVAHVVPRQIIPDRKYSWELFEQGTDAAPVDTVVLEVNLARKLQIDDEVQIDLDRQRESGTGSNAKPG